jgi:hypothetical protein
VRRTDSRFLYIARRLIRGYKIRGAGDPVPGANLAVNPREAQALSAPARQLTPQACERDQTVRLANLIVSGCAAAALVGASSASASSPGGASTSGSQQQASASSGGVGVAPGPGPKSTPDHPVVRGFTAKIIHGLAYAPSYAPIQVQRAIWAGDRIRHKPYIYAGGHGTWNDAGYDCSGAVSYVLHAAGLIQTSMDSGEMMSWGQGGAGHWITIYTNPGHAFVEIAGVRFDTSAEQDPNPAPGSGPRWRPLVTSSGGFVARHPSSF